MAAIIIPANPVLHINDVEECKQSDFVVDNHFNAYIRTLLGNDQALKNLQDAFETSITAQVNAITPNVMGLVNTALEAMEQQIIAGEVQECTNSEIDNISLT